MVNDVLDAEPAGVDLGLLLAKTLQVFVGCAESHAVTFLSGRHRSGLPEIPARVEIGAESELDRSVELRERPAAVLKAQRTSFAR